MGTLLSEEKWYEKLKDPFGIRIREPLVQGRDASQYQYIGGAQIYSLASIFL